MSERIGDWLIVVRDMESTRKTKVWQVRSTSGTHLGVVSFWPAWRQYVFAPAENTLFNSGCLLDLVEFTTRETKAWLEAQQAKRKAASEQIEQVVSHCDGCDT